MLEEWADVLSEVYAHDIEAPTTEGLKGDHAMLSTEENARLTQTDPGTPMATLAFSTPTAERP
jgi:hypothetical protein